MQGMYIDGGNKKQTGNQERQLGELLFKIKQEITKQQSNP